jgi:hypothetical protein
MSLFTIKQGDTSPAIEAVLRSPNGDVVDLTGATVRFFMRSNDGVRFVDAPATIDGATEGIVVYEWSQTDTDTPGLNHAEWRVTFPDGTIETFPNSEFLQIHIPSKIEDN